MGFFCSSTNMDQRPPPWRGLFGVLLRVPLLSSAWFHATKCRNRKSASESGGSRSVVRRHTSIPLTLTLTLTVPCSGDSPLRLLRRAVARVLHRIGAELAWQFHLHPAIGAHKAAPIIPRPPDLLVLYNGTRRGTVAGSRRIGLRLCSTKQ